MEFEGLFAGEPVDWVKVKRRLLKKGHSAQTLNHAFRPIVGFGLVVVEVVDASLAKSLLSTIVRIDAKDSRVGATRKGDSHRAKTSAGLLTVLPAGQSHPRTVVCRGGDWLADFELTKSLLIIENIELFLRAEEVLGFLSNHCDIPVDLGSLDIAFGAGNGIASAHNQGYLEAYGQVLCLFDVDLGGLEIHRNVCRLLRKNDIPFIIPMDLERRLRLSTRRLEPDMVSALSQFCPNTPRLAAIQQLMLIHYTSLEQEAYLND